MGTGQGAKRLEKGHHCVDWNSCKRKKLSHWASKVIDIEKGIDNRMIKNTNKSVRDEQVSFRKGKG